MYKSIDYKGAVGGKSLKGTDCMKTVYFGDEFYFFAMEYVQTTTHEVRETHHGSDCAGGDRGSIRRNRSINPTPLSTLEDLHIHVIFLNPLGCVEQST